MSEQDQFEQSVKNLIEDLCDVLYKHGYQEISVGALMRVIGVSYDRAQEHDDELIDLHKHFAEIKSMPKNQKVPPGTVFH